MTSACLKIDMSHGVTRTLFNDWPLGSLSSPFALVAFNRQVPIVEKCAAQNFYIKSFPRWLFINNNKK